jgi:hypothetical protein
MERIKDNRFLKENVLNNIEIQNFPVKFEEKEPYYNWINTNCVIFSHSRFVPIRIGLLNALWLGIPLIHNSPIIKTIHISLEKMFYFGNKITEICSVFNTFTTNQDLFYNSIDDIKKSIISRFGIMTHLSSWNTFLDNNIGQYEVVQSKVDKSKTVESKTVEPKVDKSKAYITIAFSDMWPGFNYNTNFYLILYAIHASNKIRK